MTGVHLDPTAARHTRSLEEGTRIGSYTLTGRVIGSGGFGHVYEATHPTLALRVAIKIQDTRDDERLRARALREAMVQSEAKQAAQTVQLLQAAEGRIEEKRRLDQEQISKAFAFWDKYIQWYQRASLEEGGPR